MKTLGGFTASQRHSYKHLSRFTLTLVSHKNTRTFSQKDDTLPIISINCDQTNTYIPPTYDILSRHGDYILKYNLFHIYMFADLHRTCPLQVLYKC